MAATKKEKNIENKIAAETDKSMFSESSAAVRIPRILLAAGASGSGKTLIICGILQALLNRGLTPVSFKCGPDYIDPMFHSTVLGTRSRNLDTFFTDEATTRYLLARNAAGADVALIEGVMGYYDGLGGVSDQASAYDVARVTDSPVVLLVNCKGMSLSVLAYIKGFLEYRRDSRIRGVILNRLSPMLYPQISEMIRAELGLIPLGYVPEIKDFTLESRHLGLVMPEEIEGIREKLNKLAAALEESLDLDGLIDLAREALPVQGEQPEAVREVLREAARDARGFAICNTDTDVGNDANVNTDVNAETDPNVKIGSDDNIDNKTNAEANIDIKKRFPTIAVARDEAFCFIYEDNLQLLRDMGAQINFFSPIHDAHLPECDGLLLSGGYPELHLPELSGNTSMLADIRDAITKRKLPTMAECGGFMYLQQEMEDMEGHAWPVAGVLHGRAYRTQKLGRFGYISLLVRETDSISGGDAAVPVAEDGATVSAIVDNATVSVTAGNAVPYDAAGDTEQKTLLSQDIGEIRAHEFHYFDTTENGEAFHASKPLRKRGWDCICMTENLLAGFPHLYYHSNPKVALAFYRACMDRTI